jgi:hypothetical protein
MFKRAVQEAPPRPEPSVRDRHRAATGRPLRSRELLCRCRIRRSRLNTRRRQSVSSNESTCIAERLFALAFIAFLPFATRTPGLAAAMCGNKAAEALKAGARNSTADAAELNKLRGHLADAHGHLDKTIAKMTAARDAGAVRPRLRPIWR